MAIEPRHALWLLIAAGHLLLLAVLAKRPQAARMAEREVIALKLLPGSHATRHETPTTTRDAPRRARPPMPATPQPPKAVPAAPEPEPAPQTPVDMPQPAAAATPSLLDSEGTRRAIRMATRTPLLSERAASASDAPARENAQQRFGREVANSAYGNCLKGEFPGGGMGVLSLPFWIAAEASGKCHK